MEEKVKVVTGSIALTGGAYISAIAMFAVSVLMARYIEKDVYGLYIYVISLASMIYLFTDLGIDGLSTYFVMRYKESKPEIARYVVDTALKVKIVLTSVIFVILSLAGFLNYIYWYVALFFVIFVFNTYSQQLPQAFQHFRVSGQIQIIESIFKLVSIYVVLEYITRDRLIIIIPAVMIPMSFSVFLALKDIFETISRTSSRITFSEIREEAVYYGKWFLVMSAIAPVLANVMQVALGFFLAFEKVAVFGVGKTLANSVVMFASAFKSSIAPSFMKKTDKEDIAFTLSDSIRYLLIIGIFIGFLIHYASEHLVTFFYSEKYIESADIVEILSYGMLFSLIFTGLVPATLSMKMPELRVKINIITVVLLLALGSVLIPRYDALGAAIAFSTSTIIGVLIFAFLAHKRIKFKFPWITLMKCLIAGFSTLFIAEIIGQYSPILAIVTFCVLYPLLLMVMKEFTEQDYQIEKKVREVLINFLRRK